MNEQIKDGDLHLKGELYLGFASFSYYVKTRYGYNLRKSGQFVYLSKKGVWFAFQLTLECFNVECGYVYINSDAWGNLFGADFDLARDLSEKCWRVKGRLPLEKKDRHCHIDDSLKRKINVTLHCGTNVYCKHPPIIPFLPG